MGVPYEIDPQAGIVIPGGQTKTILVNFPARSFVSKLVVVQTDGALDPFTVELFNHVNAMEGAEGSQSASDADGDPIPLDCFRVCTPLTGTGGKLLYFSDQETGGHGLLFVCKDKPPHDRQGQSMRNLYLRISPSGGGSKTFAFSIGGESQIAGV